MPGLQVSPTTKQINQAERELRNELRKRAVQDLAEASGPNDIHVRDILPNEDLDQDDADNDNSAWDGNTREWLQGGYDAGADALNQVYEIDSDGGADGVLLGFFAVSIATSDPHVSESVFEAGTGGVFERLQLQEIQASTDGDIGLMTDPIIFGSDQDGIIQHWPLNTNDSVVIYHGAAAELTDSVLAERSGRSQSQSQQAASARQVA